MRLSSQISPSDNLADALQQQVAGGLLQHHAARAQAHGANHVAVVFRRRQNDHARGHRIEIDLFEHAQAVFFRHAQIEQKDIRLQLGEHLRALDAVRGFADDLDVVGALEQLAKAVAEDGMVVRNQDPNRLFCFRHLNSMEFRRLDAPRARDSTPPSACPPRFVSVL